MLSADFVPIVPEDKQFAPSNIPGAPDHRPRVSHDDEPPHESDRSPGALRPLRSKSALSASIGILDPGPGARVKGFAGRLVSPIAAVPGLNLAASSVHCFEFRRKWSYGVVQFSHACASILRPVLCLCGDLPFGTAIPIYLILAVLWVQDMVCNALSSTLARDTNITIWCQLGVDAAAMACFVLEMLWTSLCGSPSFTCMVLGMLFTSLVKTAAHYHRLSIRRCLGNSVAGSAASSQAHSIIRATLPTALLLVLLPGVHLIEFPEDRADILATTLLSRHTDCFRALDIPTGGIPKAETDSTPKSTQLCTEVLEDVVQLFGARLYSLSVGERALVDNSIPVSSSKCHYKQTVVNGVSIVLLPPEYWPLLVWQVLLDVCIFLTFWFTHHALVRLDGSDDRDHNKATSTVSLVEVGHDAPGPSCAGSPAGSSAGLYSHSGCSSLDNPYEMSRETSDQKYNQSQSESAVSVRLQRVHNILHTMSSMQNRDQEVKSFFLHAVSHELRTPIATMLGNADLMLDMASSPEQTELLQDIVKSGHAALQQVSNIVDYGAFLTGIVLEEQSFSLAALTGTTVDTVQTQHKRKISLVVDGKLPAYVRGDAPKLARIMNHVLDNAVNHTLAKDHISVRVGLPSLAMLQHLRVLHESTPDVTSLHNEALATVSTMSTLTVPWSGSRSTSTSAFTISSTRHSATEGDGLKPGANVDYLQYPQCQKSIVRSRSSGSSATSKRPLPCQELSQTTEPSTETMAIQFEVVDTGYGIASSLLPQIFDVFSQFEDGPTRTNGNGFGLGLPICRKLARAFGGEITVTSPWPETASGGTNVTFVLSLVPVHWSQGEAKPTPTDGNGGQGGTPVKSEGRTVEAAACRYSAATLRSFAGLPKPSLERSASGWSSYGSTSCSRSSHPHGSTTVSNCSKSSSLASSSHLVHSPEPTHQPDSSLSSKTQDPRSKIKPSPPSPGPRRDRGSPLSPSSPAHWSSRNTGFPSQPVLPPTPPSEGLPGQVLVAEDTPLMQKLISMQLRRIGYQAIISENGAVAVERLRQNWFPLILMDLHMPVMDGLSATVEIRSLEAEGFFGDRPQIMIVALTADVVQGTSDRCLATGMDDVIYKPVTSQKLQAILDRATSQGNSGR